MLFICFAFESSAAAIGWTLWGIDCRCFFRITVRQNSRRICSANMSRDAFLDAESSDDLVVVIKNIFCTPWLTTIMDLLENVNKQYFVVHPFVEDLLIEQEVSTTICTLFLPEYSLTIAQTKTL